MYGKLKKPKTENDHCLSYTIVITQYGTTVVEKCKAIFPPIFKNMLPKCLFKFHRVL